MKKAIRFIKLRFDMFINLSKLYLSETPSLISLAVVIPLMIYFIIEVSIPNSIEGYSINSNILELLKSFNVMFHQLLFYTIIITAPIYIFISQVNVRSYYRYKNLNVSFKEISVANMLLFLSLIDLILIIVLASFLMHSMSTLISSIIFIFLTILLVDIIIMVLFLYYQISIILFLKITQMKHIVLAEVSVVVLCTLSIFYPVKYISFQVVTDIPFYIMLCFMVLLFMILGFFYKRVTINSTFIIRELYKNSTVIKVKGNINLYKNYLLMLFNSKIVYIEYILSLSVFILFIGNSNLKGSFNNFVFQLLTPMFLISNGIIYAYKPWFNIRSNKMFKRVLAIDLIISIIFMMVTYIILSYFLFQKIIITNIILSCSTYVVLNLMQRHIQLKYQMDSKSPIVFVLLYGSISFILFQILKWGGDLCIKCLEVFSS